MYYVIYRISDHGLGGKVKPEYINNENCLKNATKIFNDFIFYVIADNVRPETSIMIEKYIPKENIINVNLGSGGATFRLALDIALQLGDNSIVYFLENDYLHKDGANDILKEGFTINDAHVITLYDHPDMYMENSPNMFVKDKGEIVKVVLTDSTHWKNTHSTTMTFASRVSTLKKMENIIRKYICTQYTYDYLLFIELRNNKFNLYSCIPGYSTHGETMFLSPLTDWSKIT